MTNDTLFLTQFCRFRDGRDDIRAILTFIINRNVIEEFKKRKQKRKKK